MTFVINPNDSVATTLAAMSAALNALTPTAPVLGLLGLSSTSFTTGGVTSVSITGKTAGSTITATSSDGTALTVSGTTLSGTFTTAGNKTIALTETLTGATGSPRPTSVSVSVIASVITFDNSVSKSGSTYTFTARRSTNLANSETRQITVAGSTAYPPAATAADFGGTFPTTAANFAAGAATATFTVTSPNAQPE